MNLSEILDQVIARAPGSEFILFNVDDIDLRTLLDRELRGFTLAEIRLIVENPKHLHAAKWFRGNEGLTPQQIRDLFHPYFPDIFP